MVLTAFSALTCMLVSGDSVGEQLFKQNHVKKKDKRKMKDIEEKERKKKKRMPIIFLALL